MEVLLVDGARGCGAGEGGERARRLPLQVPPQHLHGRLLLLLRITPARRRSASRIEGIESGEERGREEEEGTREGCFSLAWKIEMRGGCA